MVIMLGSIAASVEVDNFVDRSLHQTAIRDSAFTPAHWWLYSHFIALPLGWGILQCKIRRVPALRGPNNSMNTGLKITIIGYLATMFTIGINELWHFWFRRRNILSTKQQKKKKLTNIDHKYGKMDK